jgi:hypothetical protein
MMLGFLNTSFDPSHQFESPKDRSKAQDLAFSNLNFSLRPNAAVEKKVSQKSHLTFQVDFFVTRALRLAKKKSHWQNHIFINYAN